MGGPPGADGWLIAAPGARADALAAVIEACRPGAKIVDLCDKGDSYINE